MGIDNESIEKMAAEYKNVMVNSNIDFSDTFSQFVERCISFIEDQIDIINSVFYRPQSKISTKILNYLKTIKTYSIIELNKLLMAGNYIPNFRNPDRFQTMQFSYSKLIDLQLDIFVTLDKLCKYGKDLSAVLILENRSMSLINSIGK